MTALTGWITNIIILILIAVITELIIPNTSLQKYVKMVVGLLLILVLLSPLLTLFSLDEKKLFQSITMGQIISEKDVENSINQKKSEIQAAQHAYIVEEMAVQMKKQVEEELMDRFNVKLNGIDLTLNKELSDIQEVHVHLSLEETNRSTKHSEVKPVEKVIVSQSNERSSMKEKDMDDVRLFLSNAWQIDVGKLFVDLEGREGE